MESLAEAYKTLTAGIVYEQLPALPVQRELYEALSKFFVESEQKGAQASFGHAKDSEIYQLLVFLYRWD